MSDISNAKPIQRAQKGGRGRTPEQRARRKFVQITVGIVVLCLVFLIAFAAQTANPNGAFIVLMGTAFGYVLQRSRFCFTASLRDPVLTGGTDLTKAVIIALALASVMFMAIDISRFGMRLENLDLTKTAGFVRPVGFHTAFGGFIFGIGAVIAGGCASGTLMRMGEGFAQQWIAFVFFVVGSILGAFVLRFFQSAPLLYGKTSVFIPSAVGGWIPAIILQFGALLALFVLADWWGKRKAGLR